MRSVWNTPEASALIAAGLSFGLAALFYFGMTGYSTMGLMFSGIGLAIILYLLLPPALKIALTLVLCLGVVLFVAVEIPIIRAASGSGDREADYVIVLGAAVNGTEPSPTLVNRLETALGLLAEQPRCTVIVSGGQGRGEAISEAEAMSRWLLDHGVAEGRILLEDRSTSTWENLSNSYKLIPDPDTAAVAVVSNEYHLYRAQLMARRLGHSVSTVPATTARPLLMVNYFIREALCVVHFWMFGS